ncbi:MAG: 3-deoxy-D-manno-octulosonic acid transferase [Candidatus Hydrothermia bacterium]
MILLALYRILSYIPLRIVSPFKLKDLAPGKVDVWFHMASLGEVLAAKKLVELFLEKGYRVLVTCFTQTGFNKALELWKEKATILRFPWDSYFHVKRILRVLRPEAFIVLETELWPNTLYLIGKNKIPAFLVNARISEKNFEKSRKFKSLYKEILKPFVTIFAQTEEDAYRFEALGAQKNKIKVVGNIKIDSASGEGKHFSKEELGISKDEFVIIFASLREKEEDFALRIVQDLSNVDGLRFVFAPRHLDRVEALSRELENLRIPFSLWTMKRQGDSKVLILNTLGELRKLYPIADLVLLGGTFAPYGGHNILEVAISGAPALVGPFHSSIKNEVRFLAESNAVILCQDKEKVRDKILEIMKMREELKNIGERAKNEVKARQGISEKIFKEILVHLKKA